MNPGNGKAGTAEEMQLPDTGRHEVSPEAMLEAIVSMAVETWRIAKVYDRILAKLDVGDQNRYKNQFRWFLKKVEESMAQAGLRFVNVEGLIFDPGMAVTPLNIDEFDNKDVLIVEQMIEPIIMGKERLVRTGTITLQRVKV